MNKMGTMEIKKLVLSMSLPIMLSMLIQALYNFVDSMFVARISEDALAAVTLSFPVQTIMIAVACGTGVGINALMSRYLGAKNNKMAQIVANHGVFLSYCNWILFAILGVIGGKWFLGLFINDSNIIAFGNSYIIICTSFSVAVFMMITFERIMQATGNAFYHMVIQGVGAIVNIILDPIFIFSFNLGVAGAAIATVIGQICSMLLGIIITKYKIQEMKISLLFFDLNFKMLLEIYKIGFPAILIHSITSIMTVFMNFILIGFGALVVNVFGIYFKLSQFLLMAVNGINNALIPIISFNYGALLKQRIKDAVNFSLQLSVAIMVVGMLVVWIFPANLLSLFNANDNMFLIGIPALRLISLCFIPMGINIILCASLQSLNKSFVSLVITVCRQIVILLPLAALLMNFFGLEIGWISFGITETFCLILGLYFYHQTINNLEF